VNAIRLGRFAAMMSRDLSAQAFARQVGASSWWHSGLGRTKQASRRRGDNPCWLIHMAALLLIAHAPLATSLKAVVAHVFPNESGIEAIDVTPEASPDQVEAAARAMLGALGEPEVLVLTDVFGATPCNVAMRLADGARVRVVAGVNVPMLWRAVTYRRNPLAAVVERAVSGAVQGVMQLAPSRPQLQTLKSGDHDQGRTQDQ
jgi:mannose PTS system EIIA component